MMNAGAWIARILEDRVLREDCFEDERLPLHKNEQKQTFCNYNLEDSHTFDNFKNKRMPKLFMLILGATPKGRHIEQHDIFFGIADEIKELIPHIIDAWKEADGNIHIDAWREVTFVDGYAIKIVAKTNVDTVNHPSPTQLFFLNLGGYKKGEFEEYHYKMLVACNNKGEAINKAKQTAFYKHTGFAGATSHIDDKYGVDVDDVYQIEDILPHHFKEKYSIEISKAEDGKEDQLNIGYYKLSKL